jgi:hypothetical protein
MSRLILMVLVAAALVVPASASALPAQDREQTTATPVNARGTDVAADFSARGGEAAAADAKARAVEAYYSSYGSPEPIAAAPAPEPVADDGGLSLGSVGIGIGLMLIGGGLGVYAGRAMRPRSVGA